MTIGSSSITLDGFNITGNANGTKYRLIVDNSGNLSTTATSAGYATSIEVLLLLIYNPSSNEDGL